jgi:hypothetical protein
MRIFFIIKTTRPSHHPLRRLATGFAISEEFMKMKAVKYEGVRKMSVSDQSKLKIDSPTDAILRVTTTGSWFFLSSERTPRSFVTGL